MTKTSKLFLRLSKGNLKGIPIKKFIYRDDYKYFEKLTDWLNMLRIAEKVCVLSFQLIALIVIEKF
jgi:hypothetical protein